MVWFLFCIRIVECDMNNSNDLYTEILPGIYRVSLHDMTVQQGVNRIQIFIIKGSPAVHDGRSLMIDAGFKDQGCYQKLKKALASLEIPLDQLDLYLTHRHHDHSGLAETFAAEGVHLFMNPAEERHPYDCLSYRVSDDSQRAQTKVMRWVGITPDHTPYAWENFLRFSKRVKDHGEWALAVSGFPYTPVKEGDLFCYGDYRFHSIPLKGHTYGQIGLIEEEKHILFTADQLIHGISPIVVTTYPDEHLLEGMFASLRKIKEEYSAWTIIPSHGEIIQDVRADVDSIVYSYLNKSTVALEFLKARASACRAETLSEGISGRERSLAGVEIDDGPQPLELTVRQVAQAIYRMEDQPEDEAVFFSYKMLITKTFSLLEYLHDEGFVRRIDRDGVLYWSAVEAKGEESRVAGVSE